MKPYKIHNTWVNLEDVQGARECIGVDTYRRPDVWGIVIMAFRSDPVEIDLGSPGRSPDWKGLEEANIKWAAFLKAWKERDAVVKIGA